MSLPPPTLTSLSLPLRSVSVGKVSATLGEVSAANQLTVQLEYCSRARGQRTTSASCHLVKLGVTGGGPLHPAWWVAGSGCYCCTRRTHCLVVGSMWEVQIFSCSGRVVAALARSLTPNYKLQPTYRHPHPPNPATIIILFSDKI